MLPSEKYAVLVERAKKFIRLCGGDFYALNPKATALTYLTIFYTSLYIYLMVSTLLQLDPEEWSSLIENVNMALTLLQALIKVFTIYKYGQSLFQAQQWLLETYKEYEAADSIFHGALILCTDRLEKVFTYISRIYIGMLAITEMMPFLTDIFIGKKIVLFKFVVPISSPEVAFWVMYGIQAFGIALLVFPTVGMDFMFVMYTVQTLMLADIFKTKLNCIDEMTKMKSGRAHTNPDVSLMVRDLVKWHFSICRYTKSLQTIFYIQLTTIVLTSTVSVSAAILTVFITDWPQGYLVIIFSYFGLCMVCFLGSVFEEAQNKLRTSLLESNWYLLPIKDQKMIQLMLLKTQHPYVFTALGLIPVCVYTGVQITRGIYSCFMMFLNLMA